MNNQDLMDIEQLLEYQFDETAMLKQAVIRRSYSQEKGGENNEILEFIGDKALAFIVVKKLAECYGKLTKGDEFSNRHKEGKLKEIKKKQVQTHILDNRTDNR